MNENEKRKFYIAMCGCCLLAQAMKDCPSCLFNIGLAEKAIQPAEPIRVTSTTQMEFTAYAATFQSIETSQPI